jgi:hypothetical protein
MPDPIQNPHAKDTRDMTNKIQRPLFLLALLAVSFVGGLSAQAADITVAPPAASGFVVKDATGAQDRFRVQESSGAVLAPSLSSAAPVNTVLCFDTGTGQLGPCATGVVDHDFADFFALMPGDNAATVAVGGDVEFPQDGPTSGAGIARIGPSIFNLATIGTYQVMFQVSVDEGGQLILTLNGADLAYTVAGRATGTSQIVGMALVTTTVVNSILTVRNPAGNSTALTITPLAGGTRPSSAHLVITRLN